VTRVPPAAAAGTFLAVATGLLVRAGLRATGGVLVYPLDDAYIHMAVGRNLAGHGVWGATPDGFTACTSSLLWPLLLAAGDAVGLRGDWLPLGLNVVAGMAAIAAAAVLLRGLAAGPRTAALLALVAFTPLPTLIVSGMEHTLHVAVVLLLGHLLVRTLDVSHEEARWALPAAAAAATALRYESLFLVAPACALLAWRRRVPLAAATGAAAALPPALFAAVSVSRGWEALPNSVLLKGARFHLDSAAGVLDALGGRSLRMMAHAPHVLVLVVAALGLLAFASVRPALRGLLGLFVAGALLHMQLADTGWLYRYEAYLVALGVAAVAAGITDAAWRPARGLPTLAALALTLVAGAPLVERALRAAEETPRAVRNIFQQQYQMGLFLQRYYRTATVAANDIGAVSYYGGVHLLDLYGLADMDVARARRKGGPSRDDLERLTAVHRPDVVAVYRSWFSQSLPPSWLEAGSWRVPEEVVVADRTVTFYATSPEGRERLVRSLEAFTPSLPPEVTARVRGTDVP
jgi:hypothetical protein